MLTIPVHNRHSRRIDADVERVGRMLDGVGAPGDEIWPVQDTIPIAIERPLGPGAHGGHGPAKYRVVGYQPGRWIRMEFSRPRSLVGFHEFSVRQDGDGAILEHLLAVRLKPVGWFFYPVGLRALHDQVIEMLLDRAELATAGRTRGERVTFSPSVRLRMIFLKWSREAGGRARSQT